MMDVIIKQEPCSLEEDDTQNYAWTAGQVSTLSKQVKQESESTLVTAEPSHADTLTAFSYKAQHKKSVNALNRSQPNILCRKKPIVGKLPIPRLNIQYTVISKRKRKRGKYKIKSRPLIVPSIESDPLHGNFNLLPKTKIALSALCQKMGSKDKPIASATIFSNNQQQNTAHTNLIPQIPVGTATIFCANQQQNLLQQNTLLNNTVQDNTNRQQHIGSPIIVPTNQLQNLTQQNSALMRNVNEENTNRQHQRGTPVIVSSDQQQHLSQQKNIIFQNASQQIQTSPFLSSNNIFTAGTGLALQPMVLPTVIQQPISNISGFIIPTGTTYLPTSTLLTASSNSQVVQSLNLMPSMPVVNGLPLFQNIPTGVQNTRNAVLVGNQTKGTDLSSSQQLTFGIPIISGNSVGRVSAGLESSLNKTGASVSGRSENTDGNQAGNEAVDQLTSSRATDANKANASNVQRVVYLRKAEESCADTSTNIDSNVPYIETLPSGQQIIRNLNPIDMKCISGLSFPLLPPDIKSTTATSSVESHVTKTQTATTDGRTMRPGITSEHMLPPRLNGVTRKYSLLYNTQKEALQSICSNSDTKKVLNPNYCFGKTSNSQVFASSFFMSSNNGNVLMPLTSIAPEYNPTKPSTEVNKDTNVELNTSHLQSIKCKVTSLDVTGTNSQERSCPDIMIKQEKIDDTSGSVANMLGVGVRQAKSNADTKQKKYDQAHGTQQMPSQQPADQEQIEDS
ncbi:uncharacterized protein LOC121370819 [Gigantopelta aegis]|uniref:uncharacterized protein LOC121370819 n=1 Tax=Gigantopelta aegis TaxID=1735272 RepID=UPI001B88A2E2|nr:uncharacterized protein LOC121370819 [Gigantopelta aegis]